MSKEDILTSKREIEDYIVLEESTVRNFSNQGYELYGSPIAHPNPNVQLPVFFQAMVKYCKK